MDGDRLINILTFIGVLVLLILALSGCEAEQEVNEQYNYEEPASRG